ncbi:hypothetical protein [Bradyrhizobium japonicum]
MTSPSRVKPLAQMKKLAQRQVKPSGSARPSPSGRTLSCVACLKMQWGWLALLVAEGGTHFAPQDPDLLADIITGVADAARRRARHDLEEISRSNIGRYRRAEALPIMLPYFIAEI